MKETTKMEQQHSDEFSIEMEGQNPLEVKTGDEAPVEISGEAVQVSQSSVSQVNAERVELDRSAAVVINAQDVVASNSAVGIVETSSLELGPNNFLLLASAEEANLNHSQGVTIFASSAHLDQSAAGILVAREVQAGSIRSGILLAGRVEGPVETLLDTPRVLLAGLTAGVAMGLVIWLGNFISGRRR